MHLVAAPAGSVALQPGEGTAGIEVEEVGLLRLPNAHDNVDVAVEK